MKLFSKILFWIYFAIASIALIIVVIYLINGYGPFAREHRYQSRLKEFNRFFLNTEKTDSAFTSLFNITSSPAVDFLNRSESLFEESAVNSKPVRISPDDLAALDSLFRGWPGRYQEIAKENLMGIFIVDTARFNGLTQIIPASQDRFIIYLNSRLFKMAPNTWITNECTRSLKDEFRGRVKFQLFSETENIPVKTAEHVLIHEFSHILSFLDQEAPLPDDSFHDKQGYYPLIESCYNSGYISYESAYPALNKFKILSARHYHNSEKMDFDLYMRLNKELALSPFPTPYSTSSAIELVAESLTSYVHQYYQKNKFLAIFDNSDTLYFAQKLDTAYIRKILK